MVSDMKKHSKTIILTLSLFAVAGMLFGFVPRSYAQADQGWSAPVNLSLSGIATNPVLVMDTDKVLHAIWVDNVDGYKYSQSEDGVTWTKPKTVNYPFDKAGTILPVLFTDVNGSIQIFWINENKELMYVRATPTNIADPAKWASGTARIAANVINFDVISDALGGLHVAYIHNVSTDAAPAGIYYRQSLFGGSGWSKEQMLYESDYFRSPNGIGTFIRIATSNGDPDQTIYVTWDSRSEKSVFIAVSNDTGKNWDEAKQFKSAGDTGGIDSPFNLSVAAIKDKVLLLWEVGEPETAKCGVFSQWSENGGKSWGAVVSVFDERTDCPVSSRLISQKDGNIVAILTGQVDPVFVAWNGKQWSTPQTQFRLPPLSNPLTFDAIHLSCRMDLINQNRLYVVGCDQGGGGDVWFLSRSLDPVKNWFSRPKSWSAPVTISVRSETISSLSSVADSQGVIHSVWAQSSITGDGTKKIAINYAHWDGKQWTRPGPVMSSLKGVPAQMSFTIDNRERLLLTWVDGESGDLLFSWANLGHANLASEWETPVILPSPSNLIASSDIVVDGSGRIVVVYVVPLNEDRGIYVVQSSDGGQKWSDPVRVFDAVSAGWEEIRNPKLSLTDDGVLHLVFSRNTVRAGQPVGLYYVRSEDGGTSWSDTQILSEKEIQWNDVVSYDDHTVHVVWQEFDGLVYSNLSEISLDSGITWGKPISITAVNDHSTPVSLAADKAGNLHFIQLLKNIDAPAINQENLILQDWNWTGSRWEIAASSDLVIDGEALNYSMTTEMTPTGLLSVALATEYFDSSNTRQNEVLGFSRFLEAPDTAKEGAIALIPTPVSVSGDTETEIILPTPSVDLSTLDSSTVTNSLLIRNIVGIIIVLSVVVAALLLIRSRK
jgi:hypothetical protein